MLNKSYSYLIPLLNEFCEISSDWFISLRNVYLNFQEEKNVIVIKYEIFDGEDFDTYINILKENKLFKFSINKGEYIILIFDFPEKYLHEYNCYKKGRFSKFRNASKLIILNYLLHVHDQKITHKVKSILYKNPKFRESLENKLMLNIPRDSELSSIPDIFKETLIL